MKPSNVKNVLVVGAGVMGHSIAQVFAQSGIDVFLVDVKQEILDQVQPKVRSNLETLVKFGTVSEKDIEDILSRIHLSTDLSTCAQKVDFAIEAVVENPDIKTKVFQALESSGRDDLVLATNTSSLDIFDIIPFKNPQRIIVAHWFAPAFIIPLVEVVPGTNTSDETIRFTAGLMERIGKHPLVLKTFFNSFIVNRLQQGLSKAVWEILENGWATPEEVDLAVKMTLGIRLPIVGAVQTADFTGLDLAFKIQKAQNRLVPLIEEKVKKGHLGAKTGKGIYDYGGRSETEILAERDKRYLQMLQCLNTVGAFKPL